MKWSVYLRNFFALLLILLVSACATKEEADPLPKTAVSAFSVTVKVTQMSGTADSSGGVLRINLGDGSSQEIAAITTDGMYSFDALLSDAASFSIDFVDPDDKACTFDDTNEVQTGGVINKDDMAFFVTCTDVTNYLLGGSSSGLRSNGPNDNLLVVNTIVKRNNVDFILDKPTSIGSNGNFTIASNLRQGDDYIVTISSQPNNDTCSINNGSGTVGTANISTIDIQCTANTAPLYMVGGTASNIEATTTGVVLKIDGSNNKLLKNNGPFNFITQVSDGTYTVTLQDPIFPSQICSFANGTKSTKITIAGGADNSLAVNCTTQTFVIGGNITALASNGLVITNGVNNEQATLVGNPATSYAFATALKDGNYTLTIQNPSSPAQVCTFGSNGNSTVSVSIAGGDINTTNISCSSNQFRVLVDVLNVPNLTGNLGLELTVNNSQVDTLIIGSATTVIPAPFSVQLDDLTNFTVRIISQPAGATCSFPNNLTTDSKKIAGADSTSSQISCKLTPSSTIAGLVSGLIAADSINLQIDNPTNDTAVVSGDQPIYTFSNLLDGTYAISITPLPTDYDCAFPGNLATASVDVIQGNAPTAPLITCRQNLNVAMAAITDTNLSTCLAATIFGPPIKNYVDEITVLSCNGASITDLTGLDKLFNLATLSVSNNGIADVAVLAGLTNLSVLDISNNLLTDTALPSLQVLTTLTDLNLGNDVSLLNQNMLTQVPNMTGLTRLNMNNNTPAIPALILTNLSTLGALSDLSVDGNSLSGLAGFTGVTQLTKLSISGNALSDTAGLAGITSLQTLLLANNSVALTNLSSLAGGGLPSIASINLTGNAATLCSEIEGLKTLLTNPGIVLSQSPIAGADCQGPAVTDFLVSGTIVTTAGTGLSINSNNLVLQLNGVSDPLNPTILRGAATTFAFPNSLPLDTAYIVTVLTQPTDPAKDIFCTVDATTGSGTGTADVNNVIIDCSTLPEVAAVAAFNTAQGVTGDIYNQCLIKQALPLPRVNLVGTANTLTNPLGVAESRTLDCSLKNITDLSGVQYLKAVTNLNISKNVLGDTGMQSLAGMTQLMVLDASENQISVLPTNMPNLVNLASLILSNNRIIDVTPLATLPFPITIGIIGPLLALDNINTLPQTEWNQIVDVSPLANLLTLDSLILQYNNIGAGAVALGVGKIDSLIKLNNASNVDLRNNATMSCTELQTLLLALNGNARVVRPDVADPQNEADYSSSDCVLDFSDGN